MVYNESRLARLAGFLLTALIVAVMWIPWTIYDLVERIRERSGVSAGKERG